MDSERNNDLMVLVRSLPDQPGVYIFLNSEDVILYIGKAKSLKKRVASYFGNKKADSFKVRILVRQIRNIRHILVPSESDALLLENNLIKKHQPRYNILLKDDKTFPWICIKNEDFPRVFSTRRIIQDGSEYFGPYTSAFAVKVLLELIRQLYQLRNCKYALTGENIEKGKYKLCLEYHIGNCKGPCEGLQNREDYDESIRQIRQIIKGNLTEVLVFLKKEMKNHADNFRFEEANLFKEKIEILNRYQAKSTIVSSNIHNVDVFSIVSEEREAYVNFLKVVKGAVIQAHTIEVKKRVEEEDEDVLSYVVHDMRTRTGSSSREIILPMDIGTFFPDCKVVVPVRGDKKKLLELSERNARSYRQEKRKRQISHKAQTSAERILLGLQADLRLKEYPEHIECFDNSNMQGSHPVAACVVFRNARPSKKEYRHYNIKDVTGPDDFASMEEVVLRRYRRLLDEGADLPQLIIVDGGKGQLHSALNSLEKLELRGKVAIIGIAKKLEEIYFPDDPVPIYIDKNSESLKIIQYLRNEAHRFGINFHRQKRSAGMTRSALEEINGIGAGSIGKLFKHYKSMEEIKKASMESLSSVIGKSKALVLRKFLEEKG